MKTAKLVVQSICTVLMRKSTYACMSYSNFGDSHDLNAIFAFKTGIEQ